MKESFYLLKNRFEKKQLHMLLGVCGGLTVAVIGLTALLYQKDTHVVLIPPMEENGVYTVSTNPREGASSVYVERMGLLALHYLLDNTVGSVSYHHNQLLGLISAKSYGPLMAKLQKDKNMYKSQGIATVFFPHHVQVLPQKVLEIRGQWQTTLASKVLRLEDVVFRLLYDFEGTRFVLLDWTRV